MRSPNRAEYDLVEGLRDSYEKDFGRGTFRKPADFSVDDMILEKLKVMALAAGAPTTPHTVWVPGLIGLMRYG